LNAKNKDRVYFGVDVVNGITGGDWNNDAYYYDMQPKDYIQKNKDGYYLYLAPDFKWAYYLGDCTRGVNCFSGVKYANDMAT